MGRLLFCNNEDWNKQLKLIFKRNGLLEVYSDMCMTVYNKRYVRNVNHIQRGDNYLIITGTWAYDDNNDDMLGAVYNDLFNENHSLQYVRNKMIGSYCIAYKKEDVVRIVVDETHTYAIYYYEGEKGTVVTNTYFHVERVVKEDIDRDSFVTKLAKNGYNSNRTPFKSIFRLHEEDVIEYNTLTNTCIIAKCQVNETAYDFKNRSEALKTLYAQMEKEAGMHERLKTKKFLFISGGLDSRLRLAIDLKYSRDVKLGYWKGTDSITNGTLEDEKMNRKIAEQEGLQTTIFDVGKSYASCMESITMDEIDRYGEYVSIYSHNSKWFGIFDKLATMDIQEVQFGYDPDILRDLSSINNSFHDEYHLLDLVNNACLRSGVFKRVMRCADIENVVLEDVRIKHRIHPEKALSKELACDLFNYSRFDQGTAMINSVQESYYCLPFFYSRKLWDIIRSIPYDWKIDSMVSVNMLKYDYPKLLHLPIYTQRHYAYYHEETNTIHSSWKYTLLKKLQPYLIDTKIYSVLYTHFLEPLFFAHNKGNNELFSICLKYLSKSKILNKSNVKLRDNLEHKGFDLAGLCGIAAYVKAVEILTSENE